MKPSVNLDKTSRNLAVTKLAKKGVTFAEIGRQFGISRQRVDQIVNVDKQRCRSKITDRIDRGLLSAAALKSCTDCGEPATEYDLYPAFTSGGDDVYAVCSKCKRRLMVLRQQVPHGERHYRSRVTEADVLEIRALREKHRKEMTLKVLSERYNVSMGCIQEIVKGRNWKRLKAV
jgi:hypothetical protein